VNLASALLKLQDNMTVKRSGHCLEDTAYSLNRYLTPDSLKTSGSREFKAAFIKLAIGRLLANRSDEKQQQIVSLIPLLQNQPIGGGGFL